MAAILGTVATKNWSLKSLVIGKKLPVELPAVAVPLLQTPHRVPPQRRLVEPEWSGGGVALGLGSPHLWGAAQCPLRGVAAAPCSWSGSRKQGAAAPGAEAPGGGVPGIRGG